MQLTVKGKQIDVGDALRQHIDRNLRSEIEKYFGSALEAKVVMSRDSVMFIADIDVHVGRGIDVQASGRADDAYVAFDNACERVAKQLRRYKRRLRDHHKNAARTEEVLPAQHYVLAPEPEEEGAEPIGDDALIVAEMKTEIPTLTPRDAAMRMDLAGKPVLMFRLASNGRLNVVYRREDGNIGWIDPQM